MKKTLYIAVAFVASAIAVATPAVASASFLWAD